MNKKAALMFVSGVAVGSLTTYILCRFIRKKTVVEKDMTGKNGFVSIDEPPVDDWREDRKLVETEYSNLVDEMYGNADTQGVSHYTPYVISPEDYDDESYEDYEKETLTYYADGILTRMDDEIIRKPEEVVGPNALDSFGQYEEDVVYVRDDSSSIQYEIDRDPKKYSEVVGPIPDEDDYD